MIGRQLTPFAIIIPFWLIWAMAGWRKMLEVWPACLTAGLSFGIVQLIVSNTGGLGMVDIAASLTSIASMLILLRFWQPKTHWRFEHEEESGSEGSPVPPAPSPAECRGDETNPPARAPAALGFVGSASRTDSDESSQLVHNADPTGSAAVAVLDRTDPATAPRTPRQILLAWMPWVIVSVVVFTSGQVKSHLNHISSFEIHVPMLDKAVFAPAGCFET